jgi:hypothetical protein
MSSQSLSKVSLPVFSETDYRADGEIDKDTYLGSRVRLLLINHFSPPKTCRDYGCLSCHNEAPIFQIENFAALQTEEKTLFVAPCAFRDTKFCVRNRSYDVHDIILIAEDALIKVSANLVLIGNPGAQFNGEIFHVFYVAGLNVFRYKGLVRDGLAKSYFLPLREKSGIHPGPTSVFIQTDSLTRKWKEQTVNQELSLDDVIRDKAAKPTRTIERSVSLLSMWNTADEL